MISRSKYSLHLIGHWLPDVYSRADRITVLVLNNFHTNIKHSVYSQTQLKFGEKATPTQKLQSSPFQVTLFNAKQFEIGAN